MMSSLTTHAIGRVALALILIASAPFARAESRPCVSSDLTVARAAQGDAQGTLRALMNFLGSPDANTQRLLVRWFGDASPATAAKVSQIYGRSLTWLSSVHFYCEYQNDGSSVGPVKAPDGTIRVIDAAGDLFAYVEPTNLGKMNLGLKFFETTASTGYDSRLGTVIHEMTHYWITGNTNSSFDDIYDKAECLELAKTSPKSALANAQNFEYFVEEWLDTKPVVKPAAPTSVTAQ